MVTSRRRLVESLGYFALGLVTAPVMVPVFIVFALTDLGRVVWAQVMEWAKR